MKGSQVPRIRIEPERIATDGGDAAMLMDAYGYKLDPWQKMVVDCWLGTDEDRDYTTTSAGLVLPRQNGKNVCLEAREFFGLVINGEKILHTAHQVRTSKKSFYRLVRMFTDKRHPEVEAIVKKIRYTNGEESIELDNGGAIEFSARSRQAARGFDGISLVVYDEAQELTDDQVEAIMATLSASETGTRQLIYAGTPPYPGCPGEVLRRLRTRYLSEPAPQDAWHEWSVEADGIDEIETEDRTLWYMTNPALGYRLTEEFTEEELRTMSKDGFARERLGWWMPSAGDQRDLAIDPAAWEACASDEMRPDGKTAYGIKFAPDGTEVCLCGAKVPKSGKARITLIEQKTTAHGIRWLSEWLNARVKEACCVVIDGRNGVDVLIDGIKDTWRFKGSVIRPTVKQMIAAASLLTNEINEQTVTWYRPQAMLDESAGSAVKRKLGGGWGFGGEGCLPVEACSLALWGARTSKRDPAKKMRIG